MNTLLGKLQLAGEARLLVLNAPETLAATIEDWRNSVTVDLEPTAQTQYGFALGFATRLEEVAALADGAGRWLQPGDAKL